MKVRTMYGYDRQQQYDSLTQACIVLNTSPLHEPNKTFHFLFSNSVQSAKWYYLMLCKLMLGKVSGGSSKHISGRKFWYTELSCLSFLSRCGCNSSSSSGSSSSGSSSSSRCRSRSSRCTTTSGDLFIQCFQFV